MLLVFILLVVLFLLGFLLFFLAKVKFYIVIRDNKSAINIGLSIFGVPFLKYNVRKRKDKDGKKKRRISNDEIFYVIRRLSKKQRIYLERINAGIKICSGDAVATSISVAVISNAITFILKSANVKINRKKFRYIITPIYQDKKIFDIYLDCIINISLVHIISIIISKWRRDRHGRKTSNRKSYDYGYE